MNDKYSDHEISITDGDNGLINTLSLDFIKDFFLNNKSDLIQLEFKTAMNYVEKYQFQYKQGLSNLDIPQSLKSTLIRKVHLPFGVDKIEKKIQDKYREIKISTFKDFLKKLAGETKNRELKFLILSSKKEFNRLKLKIKEERSFSSFILKLCQEKFKTKKKNDLVWARLPNREIQIIFI